MPEEPLDKKKIDEDWKENAKKGKESPEGQHEHEPELPTFAILILGIQMDCLIALGEMENPATKTKGTDLARARYAIDMLETLEEKTKNNLKPDESEMLESIIYDLRMRFLGKAK